MSKKLYTLGEVITILEKEKQIGNIVDFRILPTHINSEFKKEYDTIPKWADYIVRNMYNVNRDSINGNNPFNHCYIKLAEDRKGNILAIQHGKSSFHRGYESDLKYWGIDKNDDEKVELKKYMKENNLKWYTETYIFIKVNNMYSKEEAKAYEEKLKIIANTFD